MKKVRPRMTWMDDMEKDLMNLGVVNWKTKDQEQDGWRNFKNRPRFSKGCSANSSTIHLTINNAINCDCHENLRGRTNA
jgi:hypothetical protein